MKINTLSEFHLSRALCLYIFVQEPSNTSESGYSTSECHKSDDEQRRTSSPAVDSSDESNQQNETDDTIKDVTIKNESDAGGSGGNTAVPSDKSESAYKAKDNGDKVEDDAEMIGNEDFIECDDEEKEETENVSQN